MSVAYRITLKKKTLVVFSCKTDNIGLYLVVFRIMKNDSVILSLKF